MAVKDAAALRKRAQIAKANRIMFIWVACASVVVSASAAILIILAQKFMHNQQAINGLNQTVNTIKKNNANTKGLEDRVRALGSDQSLLALRANETDSALQVILDALPADANPSALGASLQSKLFGNVKVDSVRVIPLDSDSAGSDAASTGAISTSSNASTIGFQFVVKGGAADLKDLLVRLEKSIRTIQVTDVTIESSGSEQTLTVSGVAYYLPAQSLQLKNKEIPPAGASKQKTSSETKK